MCMIEKIAVTALVVFFLTWAIGMVSLTTNNEKFINFMFKLFSIQVVVGSILGSLWLLSYIWN